MTEYTLTLKIPNAGNKQIYCSVHLTGSDINYPEDYFHNQTDRGQTNRLNLRRTIEKQSLREVNEEQLNRIINEWNYGIKNGKSNSTTVIISLEPLSLGNNNNEVSASSNTTSTIEQPLTSPNYNNSQRKTETNSGVMPKLKKPFLSLRMQRINQPNLEKKSTLDSGNMTPIVETRNNDNQADF